MIYTTKDLYLREDLSELAGLIHPEDVYKRIEWLEEAKREENKKYWHIRNDHLIKKIDDSQDFWRERIKEVKGVL